jgi:hypothetical protein
MRVRTCLVVVLPVLLAGVAGCGGGGGEPAANRRAPAREAAPRLSRKELIVQGDAICAEVNAAVGADSSGATAVASQIAQLYGGMAERLKGLGKPTEGAGYGEFLSAAEELARAEGEVRLASQGGGGAALEAAESKASSALASFQAAASSFGFERCSEAPHAPTPASSTPSGGQEAPSGGAAPPAPEAAPEAAPETGGAGSAETGGGGGSAGAGGASGGGGSSGGIGPG